MNEIPLKIIEQLLNDVGTKIAKSEEISRLKGENFNIFSILGIETKENKTHSNFLVSLLNPKGDHALGDTFLQLFYKHLNNISLTEEKKEIINELKEETLLVKAEDNLGKINYEETTGGRVDILIKGNNGQILLENKIYAGDQYHQIARYCHNHQDEKKIILYLTLDGHEPSKFSSKNLKLNEDYFLISYKTDIKNWLEDCQKEASDYPIIRETIKQYIILIKKLTGQLTNQNNMENIKELIKRNFESAKTIASNTEELQIEIPDLFIKKIKEKLEKNLGPYWIIEQENIRTSWSRLNIWHNKWEEDIRIVMQGQPSMAKSPTILGFPQGDNGRNMVGTSLNEIVAAYTKKNKLWSFYGEIFNLGDFNQFSKLLNDETSKIFVNEIVDIIENLAKILEAPLIKANKIV